MDYISIVASALVSVIIAYITSRTTIKFEKAKLNHQDKQKLQEAFSNMCQEVDRSLGWQNKNEARRAISAVRGQFDEPLSDTIEDLLANIDNPIKTKSLLNKAVSEYNLQRNGNKRSKTSKRRRSSK